MTQLYQPLTNTYDRQRTISIQFVRSNAALMPMLEARRQEENNESVEGDGR
jgi:hypothetical protein